MRRVVSCSIQPMTSIDWHSGNLGDPAIAAQIENYELAFRMQTSVPELTDLSQESPETLELYGATPGKPLFCKQLLVGSSAS